ncbi:hypothetical protein BD779DRAFT_1672450 [Infundibulicybe gibba]|nr:hypothetical protein BD779DRAFT_1672450 [Infundibulicybe gibba]
MASTLSSLILLLLNFLSIGASNNCFRPLIRREWRDLKRQEQASYLNAVKCIMAKAPITPKSIAPSVGSRYDDFVATHIQQTFSIHFVILGLDVGCNALVKVYKVPGLGFGIWIRRKWTIPAPSRRHSAGFGRPWENRRGCVTTGPFKNMIVRMGPGNDMSGNPRCLARDFSPYFAGRYLGANVTTFTLAQADYGWFSRVVEGGTSFDASGTHGGGHYGVGGTLGEMGDLFNSPSDPVFFLHHANLDRLWWSWQARDLPRRLKDISGPINILDYSNQLGGNVTLAFPLSLGVNAKNVTVSDVMNIQGDTLCYLYDKLY